MIGFFVGTVETVEGTSDPVAVGTIVGNGDVIPVGEFTTGVIT